VNGKQFPNKGLTLGMDHVKTPVMGYGTLFEASGIHHSNTGLQITHDMHINLEFDNQASSIFHVTSRRTSKMKLCRNCLHCVTSAHPSTFSPSISYCNQSLNPPPPSSSMPIAHTERGSHWLAVHTDPNIRVLTTLIHMATYRSYRSSRHSLNATS